jgi:RHS repeat-associated protein
VQERDISNCAIILYTRGSDLAGSASLEDAGGIGGLLARTDASVLNTSSPQMAHAYCAFDGNGNVTALVNISNVVVAQYAYDPFGNLLTKIGPLADANVYRFSSKECQNNSGLCYYGFRFYDPNLQRWLNRDPMGDYGSLANQAPVFLMEDGTGYGDEGFISTWVDVNRNLFLPVANNPNGVVDPYGLDCLSTAANIAAGIGDNLSFGLTDLAREALGLNDNVDKDSGAYRWADVGITSLQMASGLPGIVKAVEKQAEKALSRAAEERAKNLAKGIAAKDLGSSGKPKIHTVDHPTRKAAKDAARSEGKGPPMSHPSDKGQPPHYHPTDECGDKIPGVHHNYPE